MNLSMNVVANKISEILITLYRNMKKKRSLTKNICLTFPLRAELPFKSLTSTLTTQVQQKSNSKVK